MKRNKLCSIFISFFFIHITICNFANAQCSQFSVCQTNMDELENECCQRIKKARDLNLWDGAGKSISVEVLEDVLSNFIKKTTVESSEKKPYVKHFIPAIRKEVAKLVNEKNKQWSEEYLIKIQEYNETRANFQNYNDELSQLKTLVENLINQKKRLRSLTKVYLQNMAGIPTTYLILGKAVWDPGSDIPPQDVYEVITHDASKYIASELSDVLVFSNTIIRNAKVSKDVIKATKMVRVEDFETDPDYFSYGSTFYVLHKYRSYPMYQLPVREKNLNEDNDNNLKLKVIHWNIDNETIVQYRKQSSFPAGLLDEVNKKIADVENENSISISQINGFAQKYKKSWDQIITKQNEIFEEIEVLRKKIKQRLPSQVLSDFKANVTDFLNDLYRIHEDEVNYDDISGEERLKDKIMNWLRKESKYFQNRKEGAELDISNWLKNRNMIVFTSKSEIMGLGEKPSKVAARLLSSAIKTLKNRKKQLISYELSTVEHGQLVSYKGEDFYNDGLPIRYMILPPILTYVGSPGGSQFFNISLFLALEVQYSEQNMHQKPGKSTQDQSNIYFDKKNNISWFFSKEECYSYEEAIKLLPANFSLPLKKHLNLLNAFVNLSESSSIRNNFNYLIQPGSEVWTGDKSLITDKIYTYIPNANEVSSHDASFCGYVIGVKK